MRLVMVSVFLHAALACCTEYNMIVTYRYGGMLFEFAAILCFT